MAATVRGRASPEPLSVCTSSGLAPGSAVVALYSGFDADTIDSLSVINLDEHLNRLTGRDLRQLETRVPLEYFKSGDGLGSYAEIRAICQANPLANWASYIVGSIFT